MFLKFHQSKSFRTATQAARDESAAKTNIKYEEIYNSE